MSQEKITKEIVEEFLADNNIKLTEQQKKLFVKMATRLNLDPYKHEIYAIPYGNRVNIVVGFEAYIKKAEMSGKLNGWTVKTNFDDNGKVVGATATIYRKDWAYPFVITIYKKEYEKDTQIWRTMPATMCEKVAMTRAFKLAFPLDVGDLPEESNDEEIENAVVVEDVATANLTTTSNAENQTSENKATEEITNTKVEEKLNTDNASANTGTNTNTSANTNTNTNASDINTTNDINSKIAVVLQKCKLLNLKPDGEKFKARLIHDYGKDNLNSLSVENLDNLIKRLDAVIEEHKKAS